jgi:tape measure domain-containing protein
MAIVIETVSDSKKAQADLKQLSQSMQNVEKTAAQSKETIGNFITTLSTGLASLGSVAVFTAASDKMTKLNSQISLVTSSVEEFNEAFNSISKIAIKTKSSLGAVGTLFQKVAMSGADFGVNVKQVSSFVELANKAMAVSGATAAEMQSAVLQLGQALASNRLSGEELRAVMEGTPALARYIAEGMEIKFGDIKKYAEEGLLDFRSVFNAVLKMNNKIEKDFSKIGVTYEKAFTNIRTSISLVFREVSTFFKGEGGTIPEYINSIAERIAKFAGDFRFHMYSLQSDFFRFILKAEDALGLLLTPITVVITSLVFLFEKLSSSNLLERIFTGGYEKLLAIKTAISKLFAEPFTGFFDSVSLSALTGLLKEKISTGLLFLKHTLASAWDGFLDAMPKIDVMQIFPQLENAIGFVKNWVETLKGLFWELYDDVIGHSSIPDLIKGIVGWMKELMNTPIGYVVNFVRTAMGHFATLKTAVALLFSAATFASFARQLSFSKLAAIVAGGGAVTIAYTYRDVLLDTAKDLFTSLKDAFTSAIDYGLAKLKAAKQAIVESKPVQAVKGFFATTEVDPKTGETREKMSGLFKITTVAVSLGFMAAAASEGVRNAMIKVMLFAWTSAIVNGLSDNSVLSVITSIGKQIVDFFIEGAKKLAQLNPLWLATIVAQIMLLFESGRKALGATAKAIALAPSGFAHAATQTVARDVNRAQLQGLNREIGALEANMAHANRMQKMATEQLNRAVRDITNIRGINGRRVFSEDQARDAIRARNAGALGAHPDVINALQRGIDATRAQTAISRELVIGQEKLAEVTKRAVGYQQKFDRLDAAIKERSAAAAEKFHKTTGAIGGVFGFAYGIQFGGKIAEGMGLAQDQWQYIGVQIATAMVASNIIGALVAGIGRVLLFTLGNTLKHALITPFTAVLGMLGGLRTVAVAIFAASLLLGKVFTSSWLTSFGEILVRYFGLDHGVAFGTAIGLTVYGILQSIRLAPFLVAGAFGVAVAISGLLQAAARRMAVVLVAGLFSGSVLRTAGSAIGLMFLSVITKRVVAIPAMIAAAFAAFPTIASTAWELLKAVLVWAIAELTKAFNSFVESIKTAVREIFNKDVTLSTQPTVLNRYNFDEAVAKSNSEIYAATLVKDETLLDSLVAERKEFLEGLAKTISTSSLGIPRSNAAREYDADRLAYQNELTASEEQYLKDLVLYGKSDVDLRTQMVAEITQLRTEVQGVGEKIEAAITNTLDRIFEGAPRRAGGGPIYGSGGPTDDKIPALLSNGEFVVNAKAATEHRQLLDMINSGKVARFSEGHPPATNFRLPITIGDRTVDVGPAIDSMVAGFKKVFEFMTKAFDSTVNAFSDSSKAGSLVSQISKLEVSEGIDLLNKKLKDVSSAAVKLSKDLSAEDLEDVAKRIDEIQKDQATLISKNLDESSWAYKRFTEQIKKKTDELNDRLASITGKDVSLIKDIPTSIVADTHGLLKKAGLEGAIAESSLNRATDGVLREIQALAKEYSDVSAKIREAGLSDVHRIAYQKRLDELQEILEKYAGSLNAFNKAAKEAGIAFAGNLKSTFGENLKALLSGETSGKDFFQNLLSGFTKNVTDNFANGLTDTLFGKVETSLNTLGSVTYELGTSLLGGGSPKEVPAVSADKNWAGTVLSNTKYAASAEKSITKTDKNWDGNVPSNIKYAAEIAAAAQKYNVNPAILAGLVATESSFNPNAISASGARGLTQIMPETAKDLGVTNLEDLYNPEISLNTGAKYLAQLTERYQGNIDKALTAYHSGMGNVDRGKIGPVGSAYSGKVLEASKSWSDGALQACDGPSKSTEQLSTAISNAGSDIKNSLKELPTEIKNAGTPIVEGLEAQKAELTEKISQLQQSVVTKGTEVAQAVNGGTSATESVREAVYGTSGQKGYQPPAGESGSPQRSLYMEQRFGNFDSSLRDIMPENFMSPEKLTNAMSQGSKTMFNQITSGFMSLIGMIGGNAGRMLQPLVGIVRSLGSMFFSSGGSGGNILGSLFSSVKSIFGFAEGGAVYGPGTGTSDSILAALSNGEFVINAQATKQFRPLLEAINGGRLPAYAAGGLVGNAPVSDIFATPKQQANNSQQTVINLSITGDISRQTKQEVYKMIPELASGISQHNFNRNRR